MNNPDIKPKTSPELNSYFTQGNLSFANYLINVKNIIRQSRTDLNTPEADKIVVANSPFEMRPENYDGEKAILLVHGLLDAPGTLRDLGHFFCEQGFLVRAILLPGHGTLPQALVNTTDVEWIKASQYGIDSLKQEARKIYYLGFSTGASLAIYHALSGEDLAGLILIAPALRLKPLLHYANYFFKIVRALFKRDKWFSEIGAVNYSKYQSYPAKSASDLTCLIQKLNHFPTQKQINPPFFMLLSEDDETIDSKAALAFFLNQKNAENRLLYYSSSHKKFDDSRISVVSSVYPEQHIMSFSHICLPVSPNNPHCGIKGDYQNIFYRPNSTKEDTLYKGALTPKALKYSAFQRLTYNPDFQNMVLSMKAFIDS
jgi:esterase/lipase